MKAGEGMLKKSRCVFLFIAVVGLVMFISSLFAPWYIWVATGILYVLLLIWLVLYYNRLKYWLSDNTICIKCGVLFTRRKRIPVANILWTMRLSMPFYRMVALTILHTAGGVAVIFADFSTEC